jgi:hypothetical protein
MLLPMALETLAMTLYEAHPLCVHAGVCDCRARGPVCVCVGCSCSLSSLPALCCSRCVQVVGWLCGGSWCLLRVYPQYSYRAFTRDHLFCFALICVFVGLCRCQPRPWVCPSSVATWKGDERCYFAGWQP